jgi:DNA-binding transcriptional ArsR family regulator
VEPLTSISDPRLVNALAHPLRLRILSILEERTASPKELAREVDAPLTHVSYHVRQLANLGVIRLVRETVRRGTVEHHYSLEGRPGVTGGAWRDAPEIAKQALLVAVLRQVSAQVNAAAAEAGFSRSGAQLQRLTLQLDEEGWRDVSERLGELANELERIQTEATGRATKASTDAISATAVTMMFEAADRPP